MYGVLALHSCLLVLVRVLVDVPRQSGQLELDFAPDLQPC